MQNPLKIIEAIKKMQTQAPQIQKELENELFNVDHGRISIEMTGTLKVTKVTIDGQEVRELKDAMNEIIQKSQQAAQAKMANMSQALGIGQ